MGAVCYLDRWTNQDNSGGELIRIIQRGAACLVDCSQLGVVNGGSEGPGQMGFRVRGSGCRV